MPRLDLQGRKTLEVSSDGANSSQAADVLEFTATFNLFNGLTDQSLIRQSQERLYSNQDLRDKACVDTRQQLVIAYNDIQQLQAQLSYRDQHQLSIEKAREAYRKQFDIGQRTLLDLLDTENEYFQARRTYTITQRDLYAAYARTYASQGDLLTKLGVVRKDLPEMGMPDNLDTFQICQAVAPETVDIDKARLVSTAQPLSNSLSTLKKPIQTVPSVPTPAPNAALASPSPARPAPPPATLPAETLRHRVTAWAQSWQEKNLESYLQFYADDFKPGQSSSREAWRQQRQKRLSTPSPIRVEISNLEIESAGNKAITRFNQRYHSGSLKDETVKELTWENRAGEWLIIQESGR